MKHKEEGWGWMLAVDLFFSGMGGAALLIIGVCQLSLGYGSVSPLAPLVGTLCIIIGTGLLMLELGKPFRALRVFVNLGSILTIGAWSMSIAIAAGIVYASCTMFPNLPWNIAAIRDILAVMMIVFGLFSAAYPGILLGRNKARPFWTGAGLLPLFLISSLVTGFAVNFLCNYVVAAPVQGANPGFITITKVLLAMQLVMWPAYLWVKKGGTTRREAQAVQVWLKGELTVAFIVNIILIASLLPLIFLFFSGEYNITAASVLILTGGLVMRLMVVKNGEVRTWLPGEEKYRRRLPQGTEKFLSCWESNK